jgi:hypothetical protein
MLRATIALLALTMTAAQATEITPACEGTKEPVGGTGDGKYWTEQAIETLVIDPENKVFWTGWGGGTLTTSPPTSTFCISKGSGRTRLASPCRNGCVTIVRSAAG